MNKKSSKVVTKKKAVIKKAKPIKTKAVKEVSLEPAELSVQTKKIAPVLSRPKSVQQNIIQKDTIIYSAIQPSGELHIGNYFGALKNFLTLQNKCKCYFAIADLHSLTEDFDPKVKAEQILSLAKDYLALGLDPKKCTIFVQSHVPEVTELGWILNCIAPVKELERMTQFKDKALRQKQNVNMGLFDYPVLQAADILLFRGNMVPVGQDQVQHVELTRDIAREFNNRFGKTFVLPNALLTESPKIMSLTDPMKKMSKSMGEKSYVALKDDLKIIEKKISKAITEPTGIIDIKKAGTDAGMRGAFNLLEMLRLLGNKKDYLRFKESKKIKYKELKDILSREIGNHFSLYRRHRQVLDKNPAKVVSVLALGAKQARIEAIKTMTDVRKKIGIR